MPILTLSENFKLEKPTLKKQKFAKINQILEKFDVFGIGQMRNPTLKRFTFWKNNCSGYIERRLEFFFFSNTILEATKNTYILTAFSTDHSRIFFSF